MNYYAKNQVTLSLDDVVSLTREKYPHIGVPETRRGKIPSTPDEEYLVWVSPNTKKIYIEWGMKDEVL